MEIISLCVFASVLAASAADLLSLIPQPVNIEVGSGKLVFSANTGIRHHPLLVWEAGLFAADLEKLTGRKP